MDPGQLMPGQIGSILDVAVVLAALYVALSCVCSFANEQIAALLSLRGEKLYIGVLNLLSGQVLLVEQIFAHPLLASASNNERGIYRRTSRNRPSYVEPRNFSMAFWHCVLAGAAAPSMPVNGQTEAIATAVLSEPKAFLTALRRSAHAIPNQDLRNSVASLLVTAGDDYGALLRATDTWFDAQMNRVSGWYRRQTQYALVALAAIVVGGAGIDSIEIGKQLYATPVALGAAAASIQGAFPGGRTDPAKLEAAYATVLGTEDVAHFVHPFFRDFAKHYVGMFATLVAISLGAPFWFDALGKLVNVRMAGAKPSSG